MAPFFSRVMLALSASQSRAADSTRVCSTVCKSNVERLMTLSTSAVAVCCWSDSLRSSVALSQLTEQPCILNSDDCLIGKRLNKRNTLLVERPWFAMCDNNCANHLVSQQHGRGNNRIISDLSRELLRCSRYKSIAYHR